MDEIQLNNFMVFDDVVREGIYDLVIGDEAWEVDYYLHENPNEKRAPHVWLTDFVGFVPMEDGGAHEAFLSADCNAEMIGHIGRHPGVRDRAIFVGNPEDVVSLPFGPPFLYFPLAHHFEQNVHVRHRLQNYGAGRCMDYATETSATIGAAIVAELHAQAKPRDVETDGARRAASQIAELL